jgi:hypothetical protein
MTTARRRILAAALAAGLAALGITTGATHAQAATAGACEADTSWTIANSLTPSQVSGTMTVNAGECAAVDSAGLPFEGVTTTVISQPPQTYIYEGNCAEGFIAFSTGDVAVFVSGIVVWQHQGSGSAFAVAGALAPSAAPCGGAPNSTMTWSGVVAQASA